MSKAACKSCPESDRQTIVGVEVGGKSPVIALAGNPNTGKSTIFNALTGLRQYTGNWPGKTVARASGHFVHNGRRYTLVDLPGTYSLLSASVDEEIARDFLLFDRPDCTVVVLDATALERNLNLVLQVLEVTSRVVICVNLMDEAKRRGIEVDIGELQRELGVPVVATIARKGKGLDDLLAAVESVIAGRVALKPRTAPTPTSLQEGVEKLVSMIQEMYPGLPNARWIAYRLIEGDHRLTQAIESGELGTLTGAGGRPAPSTGARSDDSAIVGGAA